MKQDRESDSTRLLLPAVIGTLAVCCVVELLAAGGVGLGLASLSNSGFIMVGTLALIVCLIAALYAYTASSRKGRDSSC